MSISSKTSSDFASATKSFSITSINDSVIFSINSGVSCVKSSLNIFIPASESSSRLFIKQFALELYIVLLQNISCDTLYSSPLKSLSTYLLSLQLAHL